MVWVSMNVHVVLWPGVARSLSHMRLHHWMAVPVGSSNYSQVAMAEYMSVSECSCGMAQLCAFLGGDRLRCWWL